ncbi:DinB family protein [Fibrella sp. HMF5335]|uniref:DinB family protein n=1 Tax=Fibrella rubiginis TaxID=2817060 RepID=A0A939K3V2_9BACT|nr:DinB family protein [Fibrella rubiginis]MBO0935516.1 DinB family protein [Fibrella rubiginis]
MLIDGFSYLFDRDLSRLAGQIEAYTTEESLWLVRGGITNAAGNLCLHLLGNLNEYIGRQLGQIAYTRQRDTEFSARDVPRAELLAGIADTRIRLVRTFDHLRDSQLQDPYPTDVLGYPTTIHQLLVHLSGHLTYHLGQIDYHRRLLVSPDQPMKP